MLRDLDMVTGTSMERAGIIQPTPGDPSGEYPEQIRYPVRVDSVETRVFIRIYHLIQQIYTILPGFS